MGLIKYRFHSSIISMDTEINIIIPDKRLSEGNNKYPVLYLLHGAGGDCDSWLRYSSIERYAEREQFAVVMPSAYNTCYSNMAHGIPYFTFLSEELPERVEAVFPIANIKEKRFVAGLSMGGRGAFLWAMRRPDFFSGAASLSGSLDILPMAQRMKEENNLLALERFHNAFGDLNTLSQRDNDIYVLAKRLSESPEKPPMFLYACGKEDVRYQEQFLTFLKYCEKVDFKIDSFDGHGDHDFDYWDTAINKVIRWMSSTLK